MRFLDNILEEKEGKEGPAGTMAAPRTKKQEQNKGKGMTTRDERLKKKWTSM